MLRCAITGRPVSGSADAIWDDGEWISWDWINEQISERELKQLYPNADVGLVGVLEDLVETASFYREHTGRYLQIWGGAPNMKWS